jgi:hypothetical protein
VKRFSELKVGDKVTLTYYTSKVYQLRRPGARGTRQNRIDDHQRFESQTARRHRRAPVDRQ